MSGYSLAEFIGLGKLTRGSETSQYPEEEKSKEIPVVAASEPGLAQTVCIRACGVVGLPYAIRIASKTSWEAWP